MSREGWFAPSYGVPHPVRQEIAEWVKGISWPEGTKLQDPSKYHITSFYSPEGYFDPAHHEWLGTKKDGGFSAVTHSLDSFSSPDPKSGLQPVVMRFHAPELSQHAEQLMSEAEGRGLEPARYEGGHKPHITVAHAMQMPEDSPPQIRFQTEPMHELHTHYDSLKRQANILDPINSEISPLVFDNPAHSEPKLKDVHRKWIVSNVHRVLEDGGYSHMDKWLSLVFTGSLTTYQYSDESDVDISLFVDVDEFPEWSRGEMIALMVDKMDGVTMPGTPHPMQCFVVPPEVKREDLYKPGMRSGYDIDNEAWIVPPERDRVHDVQAEMSASYVHALQQADKMVNLLKYEPEKAIMFWHQIHRRRRRDMQKGKGDYSDSNITYKMLANRGLFPLISEVSGEYIAKIAAEVDVPSYALRSTIQNGGVTIRVDGTEPTSGYAFSPYRGLEEIKPVAALTEEDIDKFLAEHEQHLIKPENHLGIWVNGLNAYIDVTQVIKDFDLAYKLAWDADQLAMWDLTQQKEIPVRDGGSTPLGVTSQNLQGASGLAVKLAGGWPQVAKFVYNVPMNHLVVGGMAKEEGEVESHADLLRESGLEPKNNIYGQFHPNGRTETFGRPRIEGFGAGAGGAMTNYEADYRAKQALEQTVPGTQMRVFEPTHKKWELDGPPKVTYMREPPQVGATAEPVDDKEDDWTFSKVASPKEPWSVDPRAIDKAAIHLGLKHPVKVNVEGGTYGQYQGLQNGTHIIKAIEWLKPLSANGEIWHELVHAKQAEAGMEFPERPKAYDDYRAQPHEQEAHDFEPPFSVVLPRGNDGDNRTAVPTKETQPRG